MSTIPVRRVRTTATRIPLVATGKLLAFGGLGVVGLWALANQADAAASPVTAAVKSGELKVTGTGSADLITVRVRATDGNVIEVDVGSNGSTDFAFDRRKFTKIGLYGGSGNDRLTLQASADIFTTTEITTLNGEGGNDTLSGANGPETLRGGDGDDTIDANAGVDVVEGGAGTDTFQWDPGDMSDTLRGGTGSDRFVVHGANVPEVYGLSAVSGHARLTRDVANVVTDLDDIETIVSRPLGGADTLSVGNLATTDVRSVDFDVAGSTASDDAEPDSLVVPSTGTVGEDGTAGVVDGVGARLRIVNGSLNDRIQVIGTSGVDRLVVNGTPSADAVNVVAAGTDLAVDGASGSVLTYLTAVDVLDVRLIGGDDRFTSTGNVAALGTIVVDGGTGADTLLGGNGADTLNGGAGNDFVDGQQGADTMLGAGDADTFQWDPGDGNDVIDGATGSDRLVFNGSNIGEAFAIAASGDRAVLTRNIAGIVTELDGVEAVEVRAVGGADTLTVGNLSATDVRAVDANVTAFGGGDDAEADAVIVPPAVTLTSEGTTGVIDGLGARVRMIGGSINDRIQVNGTPGPDFVAIKGTGAADAVYPTASNTEVVVQGATGSVLAYLSGVETTDIDLLDGADTFAVTGNVAALTTLDVDGGAGADNLRGGNGADRLAGGPGDDVVDGNQGNDTETGGDGADTFQWDPGDGNDIVAGNAGADQMLFNGSNIAETIQVSDFGGHALLGRDVASISLDLDEIERVAIRALGGADRIVVHDLANTDLTTVEAELAAFDGSDDGQIDSVVTRSGVVVREDGATGIVEGLGAQVRVVNGAITDRINVIGGPEVDTVTVAGSDAGEVFNAVADGSQAAIEGASGSVLTYLSDVETMGVQLGGGDDQFNATGNLAALVTLDVDGGPGNDTLRGGNGADLLDGGPGSDFLDGNQGLDVLTGNSDGDTFQWDPGDGNDVIDGGDGADQLVFNGSNIGELFTLAPLGERVVFTRNIAAIVLDLGTIETVDVRSFGGIDAVTIDDLTGTTVTEVRTDLRYVGGTDDAVVDDVVVNGSGGDDQIVVGVDGTDVVVDGLHARVRITSANSAQDRLTVNGGEGADAITTDPATELLMTLLTNP